MRNIEEEEQEVGKGGRECFHDRIMCLRQLNVVCISV